MERDSEKDYIGKRPKNKLLSNCALFDKVKVLDSERDSIGKRPKNKLLSRFWTWTRIVSKLSYLLGTNEFIYYGHCYDSAC